MEKVEKLTNNCCIAYIVYYSSYKHKQINSYLSAKRACCRIKYNFKLSLQLSSTFETERKIGGKREEEVEMTMKELSASFC